MRIIHISRHLRWIERKWALFPLQQSCCAMRNLGVAWATTGGGGQMPLHQWVIRTLVQLCYSPYALVVTVTFCTLLAMGSQEMHVCGQWILSHNHFPEPAEVVSTRTSLLSEELGSTSARRLLCGLYSSWHPGQHIPSHSCSKAMEGPGQCHLLQCKPCYSLGPPLWL